MLAARVTSREGSRTVCAFSMGGLVKINYTLEYEQEENDVIRFRKIAGDLRHYQGMWLLVQAPGAAETVVTYSMELDPGLPLPDWIVKRMAARQLAENLEALKSRAESAMPVPAADTGKEGESLRRRGERVLELVRRGQTLEIWFRGDRYESKTRLPLTEDK